MDKTTEIRGHRQSQPAELGHPAHTGESKATARRIDPKYAPLLPPAIMAIVISLAVSLVETIVRLGCRRVNRQNRPIGLIRRARTGS